MPHQPNYPYFHYTSTAAAQLGTGAGLLHTVNITGTAIGAVQLVDMNANALAGTIATLNTNTLGSYLYDAAFSKGLRVVVSNTAQAVSPDVTITWTTGF